MKTVTEIAFPFACGDCDPCLGGRPDQCAVDSSGTWLEKAGPDALTHLPAQSLTSPSETEGGAKAEAALLRPAMISVEDRLAALRDKLSASGKTP